VERVGRSRGSGNCLSNPGRVTIVNVEYKSTNYWVVSAGASRLLVDLGWPGTMGRMLANLRRMAVPLDEIRFGSSEGTARGRRAVRQFSGYACVLCHNGTDMLRYLLMESYKEAKR